MSEIESRPGPLHNAVLRECYHNPRRLSTLFWFGSRAGPHFVYNARVAPSSADNDVRRKTRRRRGRPYHRRREPPSKTLSQVRGHIYVQEILCFLLRRGVRHGRQFNGSLRGECFFRPRDEESVAQAGVRHPAKGDVRRDRADAGHRQRRRPGHEGMGPGARRHPLHPLVPAADRQDGRETRQLPGAPGRRVRHRGLFRQAIDQRRTGRVELSLGRHPRHL
jgi:hypothetical protein